MHDKTRILVTCEHGGNKIPDGYEQYFRSALSQLESHRGYDPGALEMARAIAQKGNWPLVYETISRLLVEQNRSRYRKEVFSAISSKFSLELRTTLLETVYDPYHDKVKNILVVNDNHKMRTLHFSIHSFTPVLNGVVRNADIGLLYDPSRKEELLVCSHVASFLRKNIPGLRIRKNYPYKGISDGLTRTMRKHFSLSRYCGIEIEINQKHYFQKNDVWQALAGVLPLCIESCSSELFT